MTEISRLPRIVSTHALHPAAASLIAKDVELRICAALDPATLVGEVRDADIMIVRAPLPDAIFVEAPRLRAAIRHGAGLDMIPVERASQAGVLVANVPGANASTVAEHVFMTTLALLRKFRTVNRELRQAGWTTARENAYGLSDLGGRTLAIVGMGNVGQVVARIAHHGFGLKVIANSRRRESLPAGVDFAEIDDLVARADVLVLCCPLTPQTRGLISRERIARMKPGAVLINVARGPVVDEPALAQALKEKRIAGAALDVFEQQPLPADHPFMLLDNVIVTPHMAGITADSMARMGIGAIEEANRVLAGQMPLNLVNRDAVDRYLERFPATH